MNKKLMISVLLILFAIQAFSLTTLFEDDFKILGEWTPVSGDWQIKDGMLTQQDTVNRITHIVRKVKQSGLMEYTFDFQYLGGLADQYGGFGLHICVDRPTTMRSWGHNNSYLLWLTYDLAAYTQPKLFAQIYKSTGPTGMDFWLMSRGDEFPVPVEVINPAALTEQIVKSVKLRIKIEMDLDTGSGKFYNPLNDEYYFPFELGTPIQDGMYISLRTNSMAVAIDSFKVVQIRE